MGISFPLDTEIRYVYLLDLSYAIFSCLYLCTLHEMTGRGIRGWSTAFLSSTVSE